jgi:hypothetical protein
MILVKMNAIPLVTSIAMVLVLTNGIIMCGNAMMNAYPEMYLVKVNVILLTLNATDMKSMTIITSIAI